MYDLLYGAKLTIIYEGGNSFFTYFFVYVSVVIK